MQVWQATVNVAVLSVSLVSGDAHVNPRLTAASACRLRQKLRFTQDDRPLEILPRKFDFKLERAVEPVSIRPKPEPAVERRKRPAPADIDQPAQRTWDVAAELASGNVQHHRHQMHA